MEDLFSLNNILLSPDCESLGSKILRELHNDNLHADVSFSVGLEEEVVKGHKCILSHASPVFYSMLSGSFSESKENAVISLPDVMPSAFKTLLRFIYLNEYPISEENWAPVLYASEKYDLAPLREACTEFVKRNCSLKNACVYYSEARFHHVLNLIPFVKSKLVLNPDESLSLATFLSIQDNEMIKDILSCDDLDCDEIRVFEHALRWASFQAEKTASGRSLREILGPALFEIRFPRLSANAFVDTVIPTGLLKDEEILDILKTKASKVVPRPCMSFPSHPRLRRTYCYKGGTIHSLIERKFHALVFDVDKPVKIWGFGVYGPSQKDVTLSGSLLLRNPKKKGPLAERKFCVGYNGENEAFNLTFKEPVLIKARTTYTVALKLDYSDLPVYNGFHGNTVISVDGFEWNFDNDCTSFETDIECGIIQCVTFSQIV